MKRPGEVETARLNLNVAFSAAVPLAIAEMRTWSPERRRQVGMPHGWQGTVGLADAMMFRPKTRGRAEVAFTTYARGLAVLAYEPGGVDLFGAHYCTAPHDGCPTDWSPRPPVDVAAVMAEFHRILDQFEAVAAAEAAA